MGASIRYESSNYTHYHDATGALVRCSEAVDMGHNMPDGSVLPTGFGFCPHLDDGSLDNAAIVLIGA